MAEASDDLQPPGARSGEGTPYFVAQTEKDAHDLAKILNPTLEERVEAMERTVDGLRALAHEGMMEACALDAVAGAPEDHIFTTAFGMAARREGKWVHVTPHPDSAPAMVL